MKISDSLVSAFKAVLFDKFFKLFAAPVFASALLLTSCMASDADLTHGIGVLNISGRVYDYATGESVPGIKLNISGFGLDDKTFNYPLWTEAEYSEEDGQYKIATELLDDCHYRIQAVDVDGATNGRYGPQMPVDLNIDFTSQGYDPESRTYNLTLDIPLYQVQ